MDLYMGVKREVIIKSRQKRKEGLVCSVHLVYDLFTLELQ